MYSGGYNNDVQRSGLENWNMTFNSLRGLDVPVTTFVIMAFNFLL